MKIHKENHHSPKELESLQEVTKIKIYTTVICRFSQDVEEEVKKMTIMAVMVGVGDWANAISALGQGSRASCETKISKIQ